MPQKRLCAGKGRTGRLLRHFLEYDKTPVSVSGEE